MRIASRNCRARWGDKTSLRGKSSRSIFSDQDAFCASGRRYSALFGIELFLLSRFFDGCFHRSCLDRRFGGNRFYSDFFFCRFRGRCFRRGCLGSRLLDFSWLLCRWSYRLGCTLLDCLFGCSRRFLSYFLRSFASKNSIPAI